jgi:hypothetical protein
MAIVALQNLSVSQDTGEKPQSKVWEHAGQSWTVMPNSSGTWVHRLDDTRWTPTLQISTNNSTRADVKSIDNMAGNMAMAHVLLQDGSSAQLASLQYDSVENRYKPWSLRPQLVNVPMNGSVEMATIDIDSTNRMWIAYDVSSTIEVRYSDGLYNTWSAPITVATGISSDDICVITAMPNRSIGVMWSNQSSKFFGFRVHQDDALPNVWSADERPASQSSLGKMADDHLNVAVASNGTLYAAVKTSYDSSGRPEILMLVRRPDGRWDNAYTVDGKGTRPIVVLNEAANRVLVAHTTADGGGDIVYHVSPLDNISFTSRQVLIPGSVNNVTSTKQNFTDKVVFLASSGSSAKGALFSFDAIVTNQAPQVDAGLPQALPPGSSASLDGTVSDDGRPAPGTLATTWTQVSGPGTATFADRFAVDTTATFSASGNYVLRLTANDGQRSTSDDVAISIAAEVIDNPPPPVGNNPVQIAFQDGLFPSVAYAGTRDTKLNSGSKTRNYGTATELKVDGSPDESSLFRWDVSAIPVGSIIVSAAIELNAASSTSGNYEVYTLQRAWDEISATWNQFRSGQNWGTAGANGAADHASTVLGQFAPTTRGTYRIALNDAGVSAVQSWVNNAAANFGVILKDYAVSDGVSITSSEASTASLRPKLIINYQSAAVAQAAFSSFVDSPTNLAPIVNVGANLTVELGQSLNLSGIVSDDGLPSSPGLLSLLWSRVSGPGTVTFSSPTAPATSAQFSVAGTYVLRLTADDGELDAFDELAVTVTQPVQTPVATTTTATTVRNRRRP